MAESVTPRTPRQAAEACRTCGDSGLVPNGLASNGPDPCPHCVPLTEWADAKAEPRYETDPFAREAGLEAAGDALAVLVPQLLDQLAESHREHYESDQANEAELRRRWDLYLAARRDVDDERGVRLLVESEKAQLLDQLAGVEGERDQAHRFARRFEAMAMDVRAECDALGERCHQLETALRALEVLDNAYLIHHANVVRETARAALGDTPPPTTLAPDDTRAEWDATGRRDEVGSWEAVEPPQPSPETERDK